MARDYPPDLRRQQLEDIETTYRFRRLTDEQRENTKALLAAARAFAREICVRCPDSREKSLAFTSVQQALLWADAAVAIHDFGDLEEG